MAKQKITEDDRKEEERNLFSNVVTVLTILISLVIVLESITLNVNSGLNGSSPLTQNQVTLSCLTSHTTTTFAMAAVCLIFLALIFRYLPYLKLECRITGKTIAWILLVVTFLLEIGLILLFTCRT